MWTKNFPPSDHKLRKYIRRCHHLENPSLQYKENKTLYTESINNVYWHCRLMADWGAAPSPLALKLIKLSNLESGTVRTDWVTKLSYSAKYFSSECLLDINQFRAQRGKLLWRRSPDTVDFLWFYPKDILKNPVYPVEGVDFRFFWKNWYVGPFFGLYRQK